MTKSLLLFMLILVSPGISIAAIYKWVDDEGAIHYSETSPPGGKVQEMEAAPAPSEQEIQQSKDKLKELLERQKKSEVLRRRSEEQKNRRRAAKQREKVERKKQCIISQQNLRVLAIKRAVYSINEKGERIYLDDNTRATKIEYMKKEVQTNCN